MNKYLKKMMTLTVVMVLGLWLVGCTDDNDPIVEDNDPVIEDNDPIIEDDDPIVEDLVSVDDLVADLQNRFAREEQYDFTEALFDVSRDHVFTFEMTYEAMETFRTVVAGADNDDGWANMVRIYRDSALTQRVSFSVGGDEENFSYVTFSPFRNPTFGLDDGGVPMFYQGEFNDWGNANQYFLVRY